MNSIILKVAPWILAVGLVVGWVISYGDARAQEALAIAAFDSLRVSDARVQVLEIERQALRDSLASVIVSNDSIRAGLREDAQRAERRSRDARTRLAELLADTSQVSDTTAAIVEEALEALDDELVTCQLTIDNCDETRVVLDRQVWSLGTSIVAKDSLLVQYRVQLEAAIGRQARPAGAQRWAERGLAVLGIFKAGEILVDLLNGGGG